MNYDNYMELYEAVYLFDKVYDLSVQPLPTTINEQLKQVQDLKENINRAMLRILAVNELLDFDGHAFTINELQIKEISHILDSVIYKGDISHYIGLYDKAMDDKHFFFNALSESDYEIYSRCNFPITFNLGKELVKSVDFTKKKVLELGGNSGGLGTAVVSSFGGCKYTVLDTEIPCRVGNEYKELNEVTIDFMEGNVFEVHPTDETYDYVVIMNLLHDFDDAQATAIIENCLHNCGEYTKFLIIEDIIENDCHPKEVIMHGLRLAVECSGGQQRTPEALENLFSTMNYTLEKKVYLNDVHTLLVMGRRKQTLE